MQPVSTNMVDALRYGSYLATARLTVYAGGSPLITEVPLSKANITVDRNSEFRRQGSITVELIPPQPPNLASILIPTSPASPLAPFGNEVFLEAGIAAPGQNPDWVPLGRFVIVTTEVQDTTIDYIVTLTVYDRSWLVSQRKFKEPYNFPATSSGNFDAEIIALVDQVAPEYNVSSINNLTPTDAVVPKASYNQGSDPWKAALDMANAVGFELFFDVNGILTGYPTPNPMTTPSTFTFSDQTATALGIAGPAAGNPYDYVVNSQPFATPTAISVTYTRDGIYNDFILTGTGTQNAPGSSSGSSAPVIAEAMDTNAQSPTYVYGPMGDIPSFVQTNLVTSSSQAQEAADNDLALSLAKAVSISINTPPNPIFDIDDVVTVNRARLGLFNTKVVLDTITHVVSWQDTTVLTGRIVP
jgi:hypothetical protein